MTLQDQVVLITGASKGLGAALARKLASQGAQIALLARGEQDLQQVKTQIKDQEGRAEYFVADVTDYQQVETAVQQVNEHFGQIDVLINNAGIWHQGSVADHSPAKIEQLFKVNAIGPIYLAKAALPILKQQPQAQILNVISTAGLGPRAEWGVYAASKAALKGFSDSLKLELQDSKIRVMSFYPGGMKTGIFAEAGFAQGRDTSWMMEPERVATVIGLMLSQPLEISMDHVEVRKLGHRG
ncbi:MAG: SDR family NAD(P)-dependent oxidoreductase [Candidatus Pacebacteria bacterium]|nr:SDR family NAD(P)-dependent oxidoreductase [Candidatus Paceibacterota bacterium]